MASTPNRRITVLAVGGTGESYQGDSRTTVTGMLAAVTADLDERFVPRWVGYPASYGPATGKGGISYADSVAQGVRSLRRAVEDSAGPVMIVGYSQGAVVVRHCVHELERDGDSSVDRILGLGFVADPHQPPGVVSRCAGWGVAGEGPPLPDRIPAWWVGAPTDMICNAEPDSLIRDIADLTGSLEFHRPLRWIHDMLVVVRDNAFQNAARTSLRPAQWSRDVHRLRAAARAVRRYLPALIVWHSLVITNRDGGRHTAYCSEPYRRLATAPDTTGCQELAQWLQVGATFAPLHASSRANAAAERH
ncbi:PE-PPE domain-containing protein [Gordonia aichiensis]|uniref:PE-PPE domain-containing protein n=1 Tax=Gordonia aichiensis NBRC 108223 TaxID=1220583 RepID=L7KMB6_9ACTN|nr:PE-PPE domain-containing protein [Gordonia aichiensis]GAC49764.1 hypothetical protein GOACH_17_00170 [Gordonia aichiensis NBRC 108223]